jgi:5-hydroxyisourate hydrolase-like protein (transthyretin family)
MDHLAFTRKCLSRGFRHGLITSVVLALVTSAGGCKEEPKGGPRLEVVPIKGQVLIDGEPAQGVTVDFRRVAERGADFPVPEPVGYTNENGVIEASSYITNDGAAPGEYKLLFTKGDRINPFTGESSGDLFQGRYSDYHNPKFTVTIPAELSGEPAYDLGSFELTTAAEPE